ncbi:hypothetical protein DPMN_172701 [Dreissena polymorpha]|uniref:Uncharacterized protein n=1 Tax=Dreissena polymorpha TaxID=45954 RepID=A0A9D4E2S2_DREPO|nr:hypothetical protein DPMN_172701 [Dreissena polymorpha]
MTVSIDLTCLPVILYFEIVCEIRPFQLAPHRNVTGAHFGWPDIRWAQTGGYGYVPNPALKTVFMAVAMDLPDYASPYGK